MRQLAVLALLLWPAAARADFRTDYRDGVIAADRQQWDRVDALMLRAVTARPNPDARIMVRISGVHQVPYLPQFYLGLAAFSRRDCDAALGYFSHQGLVATIRGLREEARLQTMERSCRDQRDATSALPAPAAPGTRPVAAPTGAAVDAQLRLLGDRLVQVEAVLQRARTRLNELAPEPARVQWQRQLDPLSIQAQRARAGYAAAQRSRDSAGLAAVERELVAVEAGIQRLARDIDAAADRSRAGPGTSLVDARAALVRGIQRATAALAAAPSPDAPAARALAQALEVAQAARTSQELASVLASTEALDIATSGLASAQARGALLSQVRGHLQPLANAYLSGDFTAAAAWAGEAALEPTPRALAEALLLRAAARFELYVLGGERDLAALERIRTDLRRARQLGVGEQLNERAYPPRFRALFASTR